MSETFFWIYNLPVAVMGIAWLVIEFRRRAKLFRICVLLNVVVIVVGLGRFLGWQIPPSGHALFFSYGLLTVENKTYRLFATIFLLVTIGLKLSWGDSATWLYGITLGVGLGLLHRFFVAARPGNSVAK